MKKSEFEYQIKKLRLKSPGRGLKSTVVFKDKRKELIKLKCRQKFIKKEEQE